MGAPEDPARHLVFRADRFAALVTEFTPGDVVHSIHFGLGDPEADGMEWSLMRNAVDEPGYEHVCVVREPQLSTVYGGIEELELERGRLRIVFAPEAHEYHDAASLDVSFQISDAEWESVVTSAKVIARGHSGFVIRE